AELNDIAPERQMLTSKLAGIQSKLDGAKQQQKHIESERKKLELDAEAKKQLIDKYSIQQFQTKKNEEYRALAHEIENCKAAIRKLEDEQIDWMEKAEAVQKDVAAVTQATNEMRKVVDQQIAALASREQALQKELTGLQEGRTTLLEAVEEGTRNRYERLLKNKGDKVIVGIEHSVCGGCHMKLPTQIIVSCQGHQEIITCPNCGRILYHTPDMDLAAAD
ncbi:MAG TPA: C4-type zinc ribbon domain-containing protein, partial [Verrucomicrobiae bacterium]|nr:C4-type zinc ribbon domain-containing protein [Verrucomicrobiae bacterium]